MLPLAVGEVVLEPRPTQFKTDADDCVVPLVATGSRVDDVKDDDDIDDADGGNNLGFMYLRLGDGRM